MPYENQLSLQTAAEDQQKVTDALPIVQETLKPYLIALVWEDRRALPKMNDGTLPFVDKALLYAQSNNHFTPGYLNALEFKIDFEAVRMLL